MVGDIPERRSWFGRGEANDDERAARAGAAGEQPIEVHEHIEVTEESPPPAAAQPQGPSGVDAYAEPAGFHEERVREYHEQVATRRTRRFAATGVLTFGLTLVAAAWIFSSALYAEQPFGLIGPEEVLALGLVTFVLGVALAFGNSEGFVGALALSWLAGLAALLVAVRQYLMAFDVSSTGQALVALLGVFGVLVMVASTSAFVSWRGARLQSRVLGGDRQRHRLGGRVS